MNQKSYESSDDVDAWCISLTESHLTLWLPGVAPYFCSKSKLETVFLKILSASFWRPDGRFMWFGRSTKH